MSNVDEKYSLLENIRNMSKEDIIYELECCEIDTDALLDRVEDTMNFDQPYYKNNNMKISRMLRKDKMSNVDEKYSLLEKIRSMDIEDVVSELECSGIDTDALLNRVEDTMNFDQPRYQKNKVKKYSHSKDNFISEIADWIIELRDEIQLLKDDDLLMMFDTLVLNDGDVNQVSKYLGLKNNRNEIEKISCIICKI